MLENDTNLRGLEINEKKTKYMNISNTNSKKQKLEILRGTSQYKERKSRSGKKNSETKR